MSWDCVAFKGSREGVLLVIDEKTDFHGIITRLREKLTAAADFFAGATVTVDAGQRQLSTREWNQLHGVLANHGLAVQELRRAEPRAASSSLAAVAPSMAAAGECETQALVVHRTLRSGQRVLYDGTVVVVGDVNPGAEVVAGGDIIVLGACRGMARAGAYGNERATVTANKLLPTQLRIGRFIARAPDAPMKALCPETARVKDGAVVVEPAGR